MIDATENARREAVAQLNHEGIPSDYTGEVWDTPAMQEQFQVNGFAAPYVVVRRKSDGVKGTLRFTHSPRVYFDFTVLP